MDDKILGGVTVLKYDLGQTKKTETGFVNHKLCNAVGGLTFDEG